MNRVLTASMVAIAFACTAAHAAPRKPHAVALGAARTVPYSMAGDPAGASAGEVSLRIRPLVVDGLIKEWTAGEVHDITDKTFVVRRMLRINNEMPGEKPDAAAAPTRWVWQRGPWLLVERVTGKISALKLPDYSPAVSRVIWFRDYAAYCGVTAGGKSLYAVVAQLEVRKPVLSHKLAALDQLSPGQPACSAPQWQRKPLQVAFYPAGKDPVRFTLEPGSAALVEGTADDQQDEPPAKSTQP